MTKHEMTIKEIIKYLESEEDPNKLVLFTINKSEDYYVISSRRVFSVIFDK